MSEAEVWIPMEETKHSHKYAVDGRNLSVGLYDENKKEFFYIRYKFGDTFLDTELHWDQGPPHGTCKPLKDQGKVDVDMNDKEAIEAYLRSIVDPHAEDVADSFLKQVNRKVYRIKRITK